MTTASISIDLDSLVCYQRIYGLPQTPGDTRLYTLGLTRFLDLCARYDVRATLFVVAEDLRFDDTVRLLKRAIEQGHEIASHTRVHDYRISRWSEDDILAELTAARREIRAALDVDAEGFRAPGYNINPALARSLHRAGHRWDSSLFPSTPYYLTKALALATLALRGRESSSFLGDPRMLTAPLRPYLAAVDAPWRTARRGEASLLELPITVTDLPFGQLPLLGSLLALGGTALWNVQRLALRLSRRPLVFEFHAMDFMDGRADALPPELLTQPDVALPIEKKLHVYSYVLQSLVKQYDLTTLGELANAAASKERQNDGGAETIP